MTKSLDKVNKVGRKWEIDSWFIVKQIGNKVYSMHSVNGDLKYLGWNITLK